MSGKLSINLVGIARVAVSTWRAGDRGYKGSLSVWEHEALVGAIVDALQQALAPASLAVHSLQRQVDGQRSNLARLLERLRDMADARDYYRARWLRVHNCHGCELCKGKPGQPIKEVFWL